MQENILDYRISYLKAIAIAWRDPKFKALLLESNNILDLLQNYTDRNGNNPFNQYTNPWTNLTITVSERLALKWSPQLTAGWIGSDDLIEIYLPQKPADDNLCAEALAQYYYNFPDFLGPLKGENGDQTGAQTTQASVTGALPTQLGIGDDEFTDFGALMLRAIALSWVKKSPFLDELLAASGNPNHPGEDEHSDATPVLSKYFGYNNPWNFKLRFRLAPNFTYNAESSKWENIPNNHIYLWYPEAPADIDFRPTALTVYNNDGPAYPFTCS